LFEGFQKLDSWASESEFLDTLFPNRMTTEDVQTGYKQLEDKFDLLEEIRLQRKELEQLIKAGNEEAIALDKELLARRDVVKKTDAQNIKAIYDDIAEANVVSAQNFNTISNVVDSSSSSTNIYSIFATAKNPESSNFRVNYMNT